MKQYINQIFSLVFGLAVFVFFAFFYQYHLYFQEQYQLFMFTGGYFTDSLYHVGGFAGYIGTFLTQFYYYPTLGALIIAALLVILQELMLYLSTMLKRQSYWTLLTFIPSIMYWRLLCDENTMLAGVAALIMALLAASLYTLIESNWKRAFFMVFGSIILYYLAGGAYIVFIVLAIIIEYLFFENLQSVSAIIGTFFGLLIACILPFITSYYAQETLSRLYWGTNYYRYPLASPAMFQYIWLVVVLIPFLFAIIPEIKKRVIVFILAQFIGIVVLILLTLEQGFNSKKETMMCYDYLVRTKQWNKIVDIANKKSPNDTMSIADLNLALCQTGQLGDKMYYYKQKGVEGLLPSFKNSFVTPLAASEIYYNLGLINEAQRFASKAMLAVPDNERSARILKRLAETNLINGDYIIAYKYLRILQKTLFYSHFADHLIAMLWNEDTINNDPEYGWLRKCRHARDFLFDEKQKDKMLLATFVHFRQNRMAFEYLMAYYLLDRNLKDFMHYLPMGASIGYARTPYTYQQAVDYMRTKRDEVNAVGENQ